MYKSRHGVLRVPEMEERDREQQALPAIGTDKKKTPDRRVIWDRLSNQTVPLSQMQARAFLDGLMHIEQAFPDYVVLYGPLKNCVFIFQHEENKQIDIRPLCSINERSMLWKRITILFYRIVKTVQ